MGQPTGPGEEQSHRAVDAIDKVAGLGRNIGDYIRQQRNHAKISLRQLSRLAGVSNPYLSQIERGLRKPSAEILQQIARGLRISAEVLYVQAGILDHPNGGPVVDAVRADNNLTERQKQVLLDVYESFRRENTTARSTVEGSDVGSTEHRKAPTRSDHDDDGQGQRRTPHP